MMWPCCLVLPPELFAQRAIPDPVSYESPEPSGAISNAAKSVLDHSSPSRSGILPQGAACGIKEVIPSKYKRRYKGWKDEFLATETGRQQWESYQQNEQFMLTITISGDDRYGAATGKYSWDESGKLIAATIVLGSRINEGYPNPIYYPVMNALAPHPASSTLFFKNDILAAAKLAHEFGHVKQVASTSSALYRLQNRLIPIYNEILLTNGRNTKDQRLIDLARRMGGTPVEIWEDREYWGEANAMLYLRQRITDKSEHRAIFDRIYRSIGLYAKGYVDRFNEIGQ
jgi:hypothetical protein